MRILKTAVLTGALALGAASTATAGQYIADTPLGSSVPTWLESLADINDSGDVAWTSIDSGTNTTAGEVYASTTPVTLNDTAYTWANGITERQLGKMWVSGSEASSNRWVDRHAVLWRIDNMPGGLIAVGATPEVGETFRIGQATPHSTDTSKNIQQSAAYGAVRHGSNRLMVAGYTRDRVSRDVLPQPTVWTINATNGSIATVRRMNVGATSGGHGNLVGIAKHPTGAIWACGSAADSKAYAHAACWNVTPTTPVQNTGLTPALNNEFATGGNTIYSSTVMRVRTLSTHGSAKINQHSVAIGAALVGTSPANATWKGWVYDLTANALHTNFALVSGAETLVYDAAGIEYVEEGSAATAWGMMVGGSSTTTNPSGFDVIDGGPKDATTFRGAERRMLLSGTNDAGQTCAINDDSSKQTAAYDQLLALSSDGTYRLAKVDGQIVRLVKSPESSVVINVNQRRYTVKPSTRSFVSGTLQHFFAIADQNVQEAVLRVSDALGCDSPSFTGTCSTDEPAAFDIDDGTNSIDITLSNQSGVLRSNKETGEFPENRKFMQLALRNGSDCTITPVKTTATTTVNPSEDYPGDTTPWAQCSNAHSGYNTDTSEDVRHCGGCNNSVQTLSCADNVCNNGTPAIGSVDGGKCAIGSQNNWNCFNDSNFEQIPLNYDANQFQDNRCQACDASANQTDWTSKDLSDDFYRCKAHHWNNDFGGDPAAFFTDSNEPDSGGATFRLKDYWTTHMCAYRFDQSNVAETRNVNNTLTWERKTSPKKDTTYTWPSSFQGMTARNNNSKEFTNTSETRSWLFKRRLRYLGQMNGGPWEADGRSAFMGWGATTFYLKPGQEEWFLFYYNDPQGWEDRIGALVQFDNTDMELDVDLHFACAKDGDNNHPRMDGFRYCSAEGRGDKGDKRSDFGVTCGPVVDSGYDRSSYCKADTWQKYSKLPWTFPNGDSWDGRVPSDWGKKQGGIYVEGHIDCGEWPDKGSDKRDGWVFVKVKRRDANETVCTPITFRSAWFHHNINTSRYEACW